MTDKFVVSTNEIGEIIVTDVETDRVYRYDDPSNFFGLIRLLNEQQATIRKLQDLCGKSDGENAKLRIENKMLEKEVKLLKPTNLEQYEQIQKLQEENRELRKELGDCEKFRYTVFKRLNEENEKLQAQLREKEQDEQLYANEIVKLNKEAKEVLDFKSLGGDY